VTDPLRFSDDADHELALLLRAGQRELPPRRALEKTIAGLGAATTVMGASHAAAAAVTAGKLGIWSLAKWAGVGVLSGVVTIGSVELVQRRVAPNPPQAATAAPAARQAAAPVDVPRTTRAAPTPVVSPAATPPAADQPIAERAHPLTRASHDAARTSPLRAPAIAAEADSAITVEIGLIDQARRALRTGNAAAALDALNRYRAEVKRPRLAPEAQYLEMEALFAAGRGAAAQRAASRLLESYPRGPHAARAQAILGAR
jgi:hypothetical protein